MRGTLIITDDPEGLTPSYEVLVTSGFPALMCRPDEDSILAASQKMLPDVLLIDGRSDITRPARVRKLVSNGLNLKELLALVVLKLEDIAELDWKGIDQFVLDPVERNELLARVKHLLCSRKNIASDQILRLGDGLMMDLLNYQVTLDGNPLDLTYKEYELLRFLGTHKGRVFTRENLLDHVWGYDYYGGSRTVDVHIRRIRAKLDRYADLIETVRNVGYRCCVTDAGSWSTPDETRPIRSGI